MLGIDGGGTKTAAWLARRDTAGRDAVCGRGTAGGANPQSIGFSQALENLDRAVAAAFADAGIDPGTVAAAVLALAGSDRPENRQTLRQWAERRRLAQRFSVVSDAMPVLAACGGWGVALIAGTGSFAFGRTRDGRTARAGGWGYLFGDEGSAYAVALAGLRAAARSADGRQEKSALVDAVLARLGLTRPEQLVTAVYRLAEDRSAIASLADVVFDAAGAGDPAARQIVGQAADELAAMAAAVVRQLRLDDGAIPLALAGGLLAAQPGLREDVQSRLLAAGLRPDPVTMVAEPVEGAVLLAQAEAAAEPRY